MVLNITEPNNLLALLEERSFITHEPCQQMSAKFLHILG